MQIPDSERLRFEFMTPDDAELLFQLDQDPEVLKYINVGTPTPMEDIHAKYIPRMLQYSEPDKGWGLWKTLLKPTDEFLGWILVRPDGFFSDERDNTNLEIGWRFLRSAWGNGYATEAAGAVVAELERRKLCEIFSATAMQENVASINVIKKPGLEFVRNYVLKNELGEFDCVYYARPVR